MLLHYYNVPAIILQIFLLCAKSNIAYILCCNIAGTLRINIFKMDLFFIAVILQQRKKIHFKNCYKIAAIFRNIFAMYVIHMLQYVAILQ